MEEADILDTFFGPLQDTIEGPTLPANVTRAKQETINYARRNPSTKWERRYESYQYKHRVEKKDFLDRMFESFGWGVCHGEEAKDIVIEALVGDDKASRILSTPMSQWTKSDKNALKGIIFHKIRDDYEPLSDYGEIRDDTSDVSSLSSGPIETCRAKSTLLAFKGTSIADEIREMEAERIQRELEEQERMTRRLEMEQEKKLEKEMEKLQERYLQEQDLRELQLQEAKLPEKDGFWNSFFSSLL